MIYDITDEGGNADVLKIIDSITGGIPTRGGDDE